MHKSSRFYVGISLVVQAISFAFMFIALVAKKKSIAMAFLTVAAMEGCAGAYLLYQCREDKKEEDAFAYDSMRDFDIPFDTDEVPVDDEAGEEEFR